jgi:hypothetical protein
VKLSSKELGQSKATAKLLFTMLLKAKPNVSAEVTRRMEDYKKALANFAKNSEISIPSLFACRGNTCTIQFNVVNLKN